MLETVFFAGLLLSSADGSGTDGGERARLETAQQLKQDGNYLEALELLRPLSLESTTPAEIAAAALGEAIECLTRLNRIDEIDTLREGSVEAHAAHWQLLRRAAESYLGGQHSGRFVAGRFERGPSRGGGEYADASERDRTRAIQLLLTARELADAEGGPAQRAALSKAVANAMLWARTGQSAWRLASSTDLSSLPEVDRGYRFGAGRSRGAPADAEGRPLFHNTPVSWQAARNDGERWRWLVAEAVELDPTLAEDAELEWAQFLMSQFGVQTLARTGRHWPSPAGGGDDAVNRQASIFALHELADSETIAQLATGVARFELAPEFNHLLILQRLAAGAGSSRRQALEQLAAIYSNRRQFGRAADAYRELIELSTGQTSSYSQQLDQIVEPWARFVPGRPQPAGSRATVELRFRNATSVDLTADRIDLQRLLEDTQSYLESNPKQLDWSRIDLSRIGQRLVSDDRARYVGARVVSWSQPLEPADHHFDRSVSFEIPLESAGAYLVEGRLDNGNFARSIVWLEDAVIVQKQLDGASMYFVADAASGAPLPNVALELFGYRTEYLNNKQMEKLGRAQRTLTHRLTRTSDDNGLVLIEADDTLRNFQWLAVTTPESGAVALHGFRGIWWGRRHDQSYQQTRVFSITDRPVYRPGDLVELKLWVREAKYDMENLSRYADSTVELRIIDPRGREIRKEQLTTDSYGGTTASHQLPDDAPLGVYRFTTEHGGQGSFRVEEYKKPEYLVEVEGPSGPVKLGEPIEATVRASYTFGAPVAHATVKYKVLRTEHSVGWYPPAPWDWLYGPGYWWFASDYRWYPGWNRWGCDRPVAWWWHRPAPPPEVVAEGELPIGADGSVKLTLHTLAAKLMHGDSDHRYSITAEVIDRSRRTVVGSGSVLVAREPFKVFVWLDRGHYRTGDAIRVSASSRSLDDRAIEGRGELKLFRISYDQERQPTEDLLQSWQLETNTEGQMQTSLRVDRPGQYRLSYRVTSASGDTREGGSVFSAHGAPIGKLDGWLDDLRDALGLAADEADRYRFNALELVPDRREYRPGDVAELRINTEQPNSTVLLFLRPSNGVYLPPKVIRTSGRSHLEQIEIERKDMPNMFVEAVTVSGAAVHSELRELFVPPERRVINVDIEPDSEQYLPGSDASIDVRITDSRGEPFVGSLVVSVYDKAVEYISGGSNVPEIREFFWKWRRQHHPQTSSSVERWLRNLLAPGEQAMRTIGAFGDALQDDSRLEKKKAARGSLREERLAGAMALGDAAPSSSITAKQELRADHDSPEPNAPATVEPTLRSSFADTALWNARLTTDENGRASLALRMPENLTTWKIRAWGLGHGTRVGEADVEVVTTKNVIVRLQAPRFFVEKDEVVLSANVHNYLSSAKLTEVLLELDGDTLVPLEGVAARRVVTVEANGELRIDWRVKVLREGEAVIRMKALTDEESDAVEMRFPVKVHGQLRQLALSAHLPNGRASISLELDVPAERRVDRSRIEVRYSPTLALAMVDALPYLVSYPYGCTEQTLSRFLPTVLTHRVLLATGVDLALVREKRANLNAQELGDAAERAEGWKRGKRLLGYDGEGNAIWSVDPVFDPEKVAAMVETGVTRLSHMQLSDGGWGWFSGYGERSSAHTTALVVHGLLVAKQNELEIPSDMLERGLGWLERQREEQIERINNYPIEEEPRKRYADDNDAFVQMVLVDAGRSSSKMRAYLYRDRSRLSTYALSMFGLSLLREGETEKLAMVKRNIEQYLVLDDENQTAWLNLPNSSYWWFWYGSEYEAHAYYLKLLAATEPRSKKAAWLVKYLLNNRKHGSYWGSTRDTAICLEAFADFIEASDEANPEIALDLLIDGRLQKSVSIDAENLFSFDDRLVLEGAEVTTGERTIELRRRGSGPLYINAYLSYFSLEDPIPAAGLEIKLERRLFRLREADRAIEVEGARGQTVEQRVDHYEREPLEELASLKSGELVEVELIIESKNDYEYLVFEDFKAAGFEAFDVRSGYDGNALGAYVELRDDRVAFFVRRLARGRHSVTHRLRAEIPGRFSALPARGYAMYAPELKGNSAEHKLRIVD